MKNLKLRLSNEMKKGTGYFHQRHLEFGAIDVEEKENVNFECMRVGERQSYDSAIECGID